MDGTHHGLCHYYSELIDWLGRGNFSGCYLYQRAHVKLFATFDRDIVGVDDVCPLDDANDDGVLLLHDRAPSSSLVLGSIRAYGISG